MDYEKKYKEAMEKFKNFKDKYCTGGDLGFGDIIFDKSGKAQEELDNIFPELKESNDEKIRKEIIRVFKGEISFTSKKENEEYIAWLEKQGEEARTIALRTEYEKGRADAIAEMQKSWSEEDERKLTDVIVALSEYANGNIPCILPSILLEDVDWLKSLRPQNTWKPSDELIQALERSADYLHDYGKNDDDLLLLRLLEELKKLKEE